MLLHIKLQQHFLVPVRQLEPKGSGCLFVLPRNIYSVVKSIAKLTKHEIYKINITCILLHC